MPLNASNKLNVSTGLVTSSPVFLLSFLLLFCLFLPSRVFSAPLLNIGSNTESVSLADYTDVLDASDRINLTAQDVTRDYQNGFSPVNLNNLSSLESFGTHLWLRFALHNSSNDSVTLWLVKDQRQNMKLEAYRWHGAEVSPLDGATILGSHYEEIRVPANSTRVYLVKVVRQQHQPPELMLKTPAFFLTEEILGASETGLALGMLLMIVISSIFLGFYYNSRVFFYLSGYSAACIVGQIFGQSLISHWWPAISPWIHIIIFTVTYLGNASLILLVRHYLLQLNTPFFNDHTLRYALVINWAGYFLLLAVFRHYNPIIWTPIIITTAMIVREFYRAWQKSGDRISLMISGVQALLAVSYASYVFASPQIMSLQQLLGPSAALAISFHASLLLALMLVHYKSHKDQTDKNKTFIAINNAKSQAQTTLIREISHDLRTPVAGIIGMTDLLSNDQLSPKQKQLVEAIAQSSQTLLNNVAEINDRLQLQQNEQVLQKSAFELPLLVEEVAQAYRLQAEERNIELIMNIQPDIPTIVEGDATRLRQVLQQLIKNAVIYTSQGEVVIGLTLLNADNGDILFSVRDTGRGMSLQDQQALLHPIDTNNATGLYIVHQHLKTFHAALDLHSKLGEGSEFSFTLRLPIVASADANPASEQTDQLLANKRVLIVDDNHTCCKVLKQQAASWGMAATAAFDPNEAMAMFRAKKNLGEPFDAIIVDYDMPQHSGLEVAEKIQKETDTPPLIIMLTGLSIMPPEHITKQVGIQAVLNKPASQKLVRLTLSNLFAMQDQTPRKRITNKPAIFLKVLIAEDNDVSRRVISKMMQTLNVQHKLVSDGQLAVDAIKKETFDLVLMDCEMPVMNGYDATTEIRQWQASRGQPPVSIIALSAHILDEHKQRCRDVGMNDFLEKPIKLAELEDLLREHQAQQDKG